MRSRSAAAGGTSSGEGAAAGCPAGGVPARSSRTCINCGANGRRAWAISELESPWNSTENLPSRTSRPDSGRSICSPIAAARSWAVGAGPEPGLCRYDTVPMRITVRTQSQTGVRGRRRGGRGGRLRHGLERNGRWGLGSCMIIGRSGMGSMPDVKVRAGSVA